MCPRGAPAWEGSSTMTLAQRTAGGSREGPCCWHSPSTSHQSRRSWALACPAFLPCVWVTLQAFVSLWSLHQPPSASRPSTTGKGCTLGPWELPQHHVPCGLPGSGPRGVGLWQVPMGEQQRPRAVWVPSQRAPGPFGETNTVPGGAGRAAPST